MTTKEELDHLSEPLCAHCRKPIKRHKDCPSIWLHDNSQWARGLLEWYLQYWA